MYRNNSKKYKILFFSPKPSVCECSLFLAQLGKHQLHMSSDVIEPVFWFVIPIIAHAFTDGSAKNLRSVHTADVLNVLSGVQDKNEA